MACLHWASEAAPERWSAGPLGLLFGLLGGKPDKVKVICLQCGPRSSRGKALARCGGRRETIGGTPKLTLERGTQVLSGGKVPDDSMPRAGSAHGLFKEQCQWKPFRLSGLCGESAFRFCSQRVEFAETCLVRPDNSFTLHFDFSAATDLNLRLWRHYFFLPVRAYAGATARTDGGSITLPAELGEESLLPGSRRFEIEGRDRVITVDSSVPLSLIDHRRWGTPDYLLAGYPVSGRVKRGTTWSVDIAVTVRAPM